MNTRVQTTLQTMKASVKHEKKDKVEMPRNRLMDAEKATTSRRRSSRERKVALQQDVDKLKKKLRHEENVHRALERAFNRPVGALPRLPPYLPPYTLELLAEVAVLEEEVLRLEEQVVNFRQGLYQEAVYVSSSKRNMENPTNLYDPNQCNLNQDQLKSSLKSERNPATSTENPLLCRNHKPSNGSISVPISDRNHPINGKSPLKKRNSSLDFSETGRGKENQSCPNSTKNKNQSPKQKASNIKTPVKKPSFEHSSEEKSLNPRKLQLERCENHEEAEVRTLVIPEETISGESNGPNRTSEDILRCLMSLFSEMSEPINGKIEREMTPPLGLTLHERCEETNLQDPYGFSSESVKKDINYKHLYAIDAGSIDSNTTTNSLFEIRRLKLLLRKLALVDLKGLTHHQKLAFWINTYNSCMMNAYLEHGIPENPETVVAMMRMATINVGGHMLSAMAIEHFILRLPYHSKYTCIKGAKNDEMMTIRSTFGLELSEPLVTFALSCGSWSSPPVRVYTASHVENELDEAKRDYLQASIGITKTNKIVIPKLLDWYLLDFAKDLESLLDWVCLQLPSELRKEAVKCLEKGRLREPISQFVQVMPYEFSFRYLLKL